MPLLLATSRRSRRALSALLSAAVLCAPLPAAQAQVRLPALGESAAEDFTVGTERRLGEQIMSEIRRDPDYLDDPVLLEYLSGLWQPLVAAARQRGDVDTDTDKQFAWEAFLVRDRTVNAFALPGGFVGVHLGLIAMTATRDELASVLAHELSHVTQRHIARGIASQQRLSLLSLGAMILGLLAASRSNNVDMAQAAIVGGQAAALQGQLNFSRDMEREADRIGYGVLGVAGFDPAGMAAMFEKLDSANKLNDHGAFPYLRSHPLTLERQGEARLRAHEQTTPGGSSPWLHAVMSARARVLMDGTAVSLRRQQDPPLTRPTTSPSERLAAVYASALASSLLRDQATAERRRDEASALLKAQPTPDPSTARTLALLDVELPLARQDSAAALAALERVPPGPSQRPELMLRAQASLLLQGSERVTALRQSTEALQTWVAAHPRDGSAWQMLGNSADALGLRLRGLRAHAESRMAVGDLPGAIDRLRAGRTLARGAAAGQDFIEASIIEARLRELEGIRRQLAAEARGRRGPTDGRDDGEGPSRM